MADWKKALGSIGETLFGGGAVGGAAKEIKNRKTRLDEEEEKASGNPPVDKTKGSDSGEIGKKWNETFKD